MLKKNLNILTPPLTNYYSQEANVSCENLMSENPDGLFRDTIFVFTSVHTKVYVFKRNSIKKPFVCRPLIPALLTKGLTILKLVCWF